MASPPDVVFITLDTVRADHVSAYGYEHETTPAFDSFSDGAVTFTEAVAQGAWSIPSHASVFTGKYPAEHGATTDSPVLGHDATLPAVLSAAGYETHAVSPNEYVRPATGFGHGFDTFETLSGLTEPAATADLLGPLCNWGAGTPAVRRPLESTLNTLRSRGAATDSPDRAETAGVLDRVETVLSGAASPVFLFVNLFDAHLPRSPAPAHADRFVDDDLDDVQVVTNERAALYGDYQMGPRATRKMRQLYDADLRTTDDRLDRLLGVLREAGVFEDALVAVFADHGESLGGFGLFGHQHSVFDATVRVPLAVRFPGGDTGRVTEQVELRRLYHTALDEAGVEGYPDLSLASGDGDETARGAFYSPGLDLPALYWDREVRHDPAFLGEPVRFARGDGTKRLEFAGQEWLFEPPESGTGTIGRDAVPERYDWTTPAGAADD